MAMDFAAFKEWFRARRRYILYAVLVAAALMLIVLARGNYYPIAFVDSQPLSARQFWKNYRAASLYYQNVVKTYASTSTPLGDAAPGDLEAAVLTQLVEGVLVDHAAREKVGGVLDALVTEKVKRYDDDAQFRRAVEVLYGLRFDEFKEEVLIPQAKRDILASRLFFEDEGFDAWLSRAKQAARVTFLTGKFFWDGQEVKSAPP